MAMFQFSARQVELNFCDQIKCVVPLTDEVQKKVQDAAKELLRVSQAAKDSDNKEHTLDDPSWTRSTRFSARACPTRFSA